MLKTLLKLVFKGLFRIKINGQYQAFGQEKTLIIANHQSFLDGIILGLFLPVSPIFVINTQMASKFIIRIFLRFTPHITIDPSNPMALKHIIRVIHSGKPVVIFPEGRITTTGGMMKIYEGSAFVAAKTGAFIQPIVIEGAKFSTFSRMPNSFPKRLFPRISLSYAEPFFIDVQEVKSIKERRAKAASVMQIKMQNAIFNARKQQDLFSAFLEAKKTYGASTRIVEDIKQTPYTYKAVLKMSLILGRIASKMSVKNERIGVLLPTAAPALGLILGLCANDRTPALLNFTAGSDGLKNACEAARIKTIITSSAFVEAAKLAPKLEALTDINIVMLESFKSKITLFDKLWLILFALPFAHLLNRPKNPHDEAVVLFTSGTEGKPKGVVLSHDNLLANNAQINAIIDLNTNDVMLNALPIFHSFGLSAGTLLPILSGVKLFMYPSPLHYRVIPEIAYDRSCTIMLGTSTFLGNYAKVANPYDFYRLRYVVSGAEKLSSSVQQLWFEKFGIRIFEGYGTTETSPVLSVNVPLAFKSGTVGRLLPSVEARLEKVAGVNEGGILHVKAPNVMKGNVRAENNGVLEPPIEGWYNTGDIVEIDNEGFVHIKGRVKRFAKIAGEMISLESVEKLAFSASPKHQHAVLSKPDAKRGESLVLFSTDENLSRQMLSLTAKAGGYPEIAVPREIVYKKSIPLLGTGKTDYVSLKELLEAEHV